MDTFEEEQIFPALGEDEIELEDPETEIDEALRDYMTNEGHREDSKLEAQADEEKDELDVEEEIEKLPYEINALANQEDDKKLIESIDGMAEVLQRQNHFATDSFSKELYVFISHGELGGVYIEATESIGFAIKKIAKQHGRAAIWAKASRQVEVYNWINKGLPRLENPDCRNVNVANGLIYLTPRGELIDFTPEWSSDYLTTVKLPVSYDPNASCPAWEQFIAEIFPVDAQHIAWQLAALLMIPLKNKAASAIILKGDKNTGKTTFQNGLMAFIGKNNVANLSIDKFGERFQDVQLKGKLANIVGEMPKVKLTNHAVNVIKQLIGNDALSGELKHGKNFTFYSYARCLFSCNDMPRVDSDDAFFDRFIIIPFLKSFDKDPVKEKNLNETLSSPEELSGLLNKALAALPSLMEYGIKPTESMKEAHSVVVEENDPIIGWYKEHVGFGGRVFCSELHEHYKKHEPMDIPRRSNVAFGRALKKLLPVNVKKSQELQSDDSRPYIYLGIHLKEAIEEVNQGDFMEIELDESNISIN